MLYDRQSIEIMSQRFRANFVNSLSGFKSANLVGTVDAGGVTNLSVVSSAFHLGANPPLMGIIFRPDIAERHTLDNIRATKVFTLNHIAPDFLVQAHQSSARYPREISEFEMVGLTAVFESDFAAPLVGESKLSVGLVLREEIPLAINGTHMIIGEVQFVQLTETAVADDGYIDIEQLATVSVSGLDSYHSTARIDRLPYAKP